jgi:hypothetical protein
MIQFEKDGEIPGLVEHFSTGPETRKLQYPSKTEPLTAESNNLGSVRCRTAAEDDRLRLCKHQPEPAPKARKEIFIMEKYNVSNKHAMRYILLIALVVVLSAAFLVGRPQSALADKLTAPPVPDQLKVQEGARLFLIGHAIGFQNYVCLPSGAGFAFSLFTPQAILFNDSNEQIITHFFSTNPENNIIRATWISSQDSSTVWAAVAPDGVYTGSDFVEEGAVAWLLLNVEHHQDGPNGGDKLSHTIQIQRVNTHGGVAPSVGCASLTDVGKRAFVPYTADYVFYK